ncbi:MAG: acid shock protein [Bacteroidales bacterium]|nr:acid shock protein [Candidatus Colicola equi]
MKKILSFVMVVAMALSLSAFAPMTTKKVAHKAMPRIEQKAPVAPAAQSARLATPQARKAMATAMALQTKKQQPQVKHVAKKNIVRKAVNRKAAMASSELYKVNFTTTQGGWTIQNKELSSLTYVWKQDAQYGMKASAYNKQAYAAESWLISPAIDLTSATEATLKLNQAVNKGAATNLKVKVSADNGVNWSNLSINMPAGTSWTYQEDEADLTAYVGSSIKLAFAYVSTTAVCPTWQIKDLVITGEGGTPVPPTPPTGDVEIQGLVYAEAYYSDGYWDFDIYADDATDYFPEVYFSCFDEAPSQTSIVGTYDVYWAGYWASENDSVLTADEAVGSLTVTCVEQGVYNFVGSFVGEDGKTYTWNAQNIEVQAWDDEYNEITLTDGGEPVPPTPGEKYEVDMNADFEVSVEDFSGWFTIVDATVTASNDSIDFTAKVYSWEQEAFYGVEWSGEELECEFVLNGVEQTITSATLLATQEGDVTKATVVLVTASGAQYTLNLTYVIPEPKETVNVDYPQGVMGEYYPSTNDYYFYAENEGENIMSLDIFTSNLEGTYTMDDMDMYYTGFAKVNGTDTTWVAPYSIDATITNVEDTFRIAVDFFGKDTINYHITSWYVAPAAKDTVTLNYANALYEDALEAYESAMVYGENANDFIQLYFAEIAQVAGDFTLADLYADYSYIGLVNGTDTTYVAFTSAEINVAVNGEVATITAGLMGTDTMYYKVTMTATIEKYEEDMYQYDEEEDVKDSFNAQTDQLTWDTSYFAEYGVVFLSVVKADESANIILEFVSDVATIANGTYPIAVDGDGTFVVASAGFDEAENYDYPSYYAQYDDQYMYPWYIVSGTVTVSDEAIVVAGVNSRDKKVDITITLNQPTGDPIIISDDYLRLNDNVKKFMYKGNVMINVNGVIYNVMGAKVAR